MRTVIGAMVGGIVGYWFRPSVPLLGQLPFATVISRGENLHGIDTILKGIAAQSFNYIIGGLVIGALAGLVLTRIDFGNHTQGSN